MAEINFNDLKDTIKLLNEACGTSIKTVAVKKEAMAEELKKAIDGGLENVPEEVTAFYDECIKNAPTAETPTEEAAADDSVDFVSFADTLGVEIGDGEERSQTKENLLAAINGLSDDEWKALPDDLKDWDTEMDKAAKAAEDGSGKSDGASKKKKTPKEPKEKVDPSKPRPDFKFNAGTSSRQIMDVFESLSAKAEGGGVDVADIIAGAKAGGVKSKNLDGRVRTTLNYARRPQGGEQVEKGGKDMFYPKGMAPPPPPPKPKKEKETKEAEDTTE